MELKIKNVTFPEAIEFNYDEIRQEVQERVRHYETLVYTDEQIKEAKKDVAALRKFTKALSDERIRIKRQCLKPYEEFEAKIKELTAIVEKPISMIDSQVKEYEETQRQKKQQDIQELFAEMGFQPFVTLEMVMDAKWLNASTSLASVKKQMQEAMIRIGDDVFTLSQLPEYSFEATEVYKSTLNLQKAIAESQRLTDQARRKAEYEAEQTRLKAAEEARRLKAAEEARRQEAEIKKQETETQEAVRDTDGKAGQGTPKENSEVASGETVYQLNFRVWATKPQLLGLRQYMTDNGIKFGRVG